MGRNLVIGRAAQQRLAMLPPERNAYPTRRFPSVRKILTGKPELSQTRRVTTIQAIHESY
jgi:hypothetical protein